MTLLSPLWLQADLYPAATDRRLIDATLTAGACGSADLKVSPRSAGANMTVDVAPGNVVVPGISGSYVCASDAVFNVGIAAAPGTGSRIDLIIARVRDSQATGSGTDSDWVIEAVTGTASGTPAVPATPNYSIVLARVTVPAGTASITTARLADYRTAATPPGMRWVTLPGQGRTGQVIGTTDGRVWTWDGAAWGELSLVSQVASQIATPADHTANTSADVWGTLTIPAPGRKCIITGQVAGCLASAATSGTLGTVYLQISDNNGSTWSKSPDVNGSSANALTPIPFSAFWRITTAGAGIIQVRAMVQSDTSTLCTFVDGTLMATVTPIS